MKEQIEQKIKEWIEEDVNNLDGYFGYTDSSEFLLKGYNQALQDLRTKAPQLTEEIVRVVVEEIENSKIVKSSIEGGVDFMLRDAVNSVLEHLKNKIKNL
jgi:hypothetical protein